MMLPGLPGPALADAGATLDGGDKWVEVLWRRADPEVVVFANLLSHAECDALIEEARPRLSTSLTVDVATGDELLHADRTSEGMFFERGESEVVQRVENRITKLLRWPAKHGEGLQVLRYTHGGQYLPHFDYFDPREAGTPKLVGRGGQRVATLIMYLHSPEAGGATVFPELNLQVTPTRGRAVFFSYAEPAPSSLSLHGGAPVLAGEKWIATKWLRQDVFN
jgi:prolyl 4-hydroxylase